MILLNLRENTKFEKDLIYNKSLDISLREDIVNFNINISEKEILENIKKEFFIDNFQNHKELKNKYFGEQISLNLHEVEKFLESKLNI